LTVPPTLPTDDALPADVRSRGAITLLFGLSTERFAT
jgi:hypothetical protein